MTTLQLGVCAFLFAILVGIGFGVLSAFKQNSIVDYLGVPVPNFVMAAQALGALPLRVVTVHMLPNTLGPVIVTVTFGIPLAIFAEAVLGFLGFSLPPPTVNLGTLVNSGLVYYRSNIWELAVPSIAIAALMLTFTFIGDGLRDALGPRSRND